MLNHTIQRLLTGCVGAHSSVADAERERQGVTGGLELDWTMYPEDAAASVVHHTAILRNKRLLLIYT